MIRFSTAEPVALAARDPWPVLGALGVAVLALHLLAILAFTAAGPDDPRPLVAAPTIQIRSLPMAERPASPLPPTAAMAATAPVPPGEKRPAPRGNAALAAAAVDAGRAPEAAPAQEVPAEPEPATSETPLQVPVYATRLPPPGLWRYRLQRGPVVGDAELQWAPQADAHYELRLQGRVAGVSVLDWASQGEIDAAGVAPERFALRRRGRDRQAANFQRDAGKITFSGPTHELPLLPGAQDRLSWIVQLAAIVAAAPDRFGAGATVRVFVAGARGDADVWTFVVEGVEAIGGVAALKLLREPRKPYDTRAEVWLDPAEHYMPLRVLQTPSGGGPALDLSREREAR